MKHFRTILPIILLIGSMKLLDYQAEASALMKVSELPPIQTLIDCQVESSEFEEPYLFSLIPYSIQEVPLQESMTAVDAHVQAERDAVAALDQILDKVKKLYLLKRLIVASLPKQEAPRAVVAFNDCVC